MNTSKLRRLVGIVIATLVALPAMAMMMISPAAATTADNVVSLARANLGKMACHTTSLGTYGFDTSCTVGEAWCADFVKWVWRNSGLSDKGLTPAAASFYQYGLTNGTLHSSPRVGDAVVYDYHNGWAAHVGLVSEVRGDGTIQVINGNYGSSWNTSSVQYSTGTGAVGAYIGGQRISGFISAVGITGGGGGGTVEVSTASDVTGDGYADVLAMKPDGTLVLYPNNINNDGAYYGGGQQVGAGFNGFTKVFGGDVTGDGYAEVLALQTNGELMMYPNNVNNTGTYYSSAILVGVGFGQFTALASADITGDGYADLLALQSNGELMLYPNNYNLTGAYYGDAIRIGVGFNQFTKLSFADVTADGYADILAMESDGDLRLYGNSINSAGTYFSGNTVVGNGFGQFGKVAAGDVTGDGYADLLTVKSDGSMHLYGNNVNNTGQYFGGSSQVGAGFGQFNRFV